MFNTRYNRLVHTVPIDPFNNPECLKKQLMDLDAVIIPGGGQKLFEDISPQAIQRIMKQVRKINKDPFSARDEQDFPVQVTYLHNLHRTIQMVKDINGNHKTLPLWAEGQGFEALMILESKSMDRPEEAPDYKYNEIEIEQNRDTKEEPGDMAKYFYKYFDRKLSPAFHDDLKGISMKSFIEDQTLPRFYNIVSFGKPMFLGEFDRTKGKKEHKVRSYSNHFIFNFRI